LVNHEIREEDGKIELKGPKIGNLRMATRTRTA
jgi:hypothetical protein